MSYEDELVERHIREYESRMQHIDEMLEKATKALPLGEEELAAELAKLQEERDNLESRLNELRKLSANEWAKQGGPLVFWDQVGLRLEKLLKRLGVE